MTAGLHEVMTTCNLSCLMICLQKIKHLEWWRLCFFLATLAPVCWATSLAVKLLVMAVESQLFIAKNVLYFMAAIKVMPVYCIVTQVLAVNLYVSHHTVLRHAVVQHAVRASLFWNHVYALLPKFNHVLSTFGRRCCHL